MGDFSLGYHETMDTHEMLNFKTDSLLKSKMVTGICFDNDLKKLLEKDVHQSIQAIQELKEIYKNGKTHYEGR